MARPSPTPTRLKILRGNPGKRPLPKGEPQPKTEAPKPPADMQGEALEEWQRIVPQLLTLGLLTKIDRVCLVGYCECWARYRHAEAQLRETGLVIASPSGYALQNPWLAISNRALKDLKGFAAEFGLSPSSRARVTASPTTQDDKAHGKAKYFQPAS